MRISDWSSDVCSADHQAIVHANGLATRLQDFGAYRDFLVARLHTHGLELDSLILILGHGAGLGTNQQATELLLEGHLLVLACRRSEERRVGKECVRPGRARGWTST